jgi:drug/metabolite transporter (DMT)-like permease
MPAANRSPIASGVVLAVASAVAFGVTTPLIAAWGTDVEPLSTAALLYAGAALISVLLRPFVKRRGASLRRRELSRLVTIALLGAALAPTLLVWGLSRAGPTASSLALNFEAVFTVLLASAVYHEHIGSRVAAAACAMLGGGVLVALDGVHGASGVQWLGLLAVLGATVCWAMDNTLSRKLAEFPPGDVVAAKGALGAAVTLVLAFVLGERAPAPVRALALTLIGATGYGLSLRLYLLAQRRIGAARTASVFATGPFVGASLAWLLGDRHAGALTAVGAVSFAIGVALHLTERHSHRHAHPALEHEHAHRHDDGHHDHVHDPPVPGEHTHPHRHETLVHDHEHAPDIHHEHRH